MTRREIFPEGPTTPETRAALIALDAAGALDPADFDAESADRGTPCPWCGETASIGIFEAWGHDFMLDACCGVMAECAARMMDDDAAFGAEILRVAEAESLLGRGSLRRVAAEDGRLLLDWRLRPARIAFQAARAFVARNHRHCPPPVGWRWGHGVANGPTLVGVAIVGRPVARRIDARAVVEVTRLCIDRDLPEALRRNAASMLLGAAAREARRLGFSRIITYTLAEESGASLRAAGFIEDGSTRGGRWSRAGRARPRADAGPTGPKTRWLRALDRLR